MLFFRKHSIADGFGAGSGKAITSVVGKEMTIKGDITFKGMVRLEGSIDGNVRGEHLILAGTGKVTGDIEAHSFVCQGKVEGGVRVRQLFMKKGGTLTGNVETVDLLVENGAVLNGEVRAKAAEHAHPAGTPAGALREAGAA